LEREDTVAFVTYAPDADIESFRGTPVLFCWELIELPAAPVIRFRAAILDDPAAPFFLEHFLNVEDPEQARSLSRLFDQERIIFDFCGDEFEYAYSKHLPHPEDMRQDLGMRAAQAMHFVAAIAGDARDFDHAKAELQQRTSKFDLGQVVATPGALDALHTARYMTTPQIEALFWQRTGAGKWGSLKPCQRRLQQLTRHSLVRRIEQPVKRGEGSMPLPDHQ
jgi:hypothetical protein